MLKKMLYLAVVGLVLGLGASARAVVVDLNSPQTGTVVHPGDTIEYTLTITNDTNAPDIVRVTLFAAVDANVLDVYSARMRLRPNEVIKRTMKIEIPENLPLKEPKFVTIGVKAFGRLSRTESEDRISFVLAPYPNSN